MEVFLDDTILKLEKLEYIIFIQKGDQNIINFDLLTIIIIMEI
jgi:hypothetical protein